MNIFPVFYRWRGSIYKLVWLDLICFLFLYYSLNIVYRAVLDEEQKKWVNKLIQTVWWPNNIINIIYFHFHFHFLAHGDHIRIFEGIVKYCATYSNLIPLSFVLGFYVTIVMTRWWNQYVSIPWPDTFAVYVSANIHGQVTHIRLNNF